MSGGTGGTGVLAGQTRGEIDKIASRKGLIAFYPKDRELLIDFDEPFETGVIKLAAHLGTSPVSLTLKSADEIEIVEQFFTRSKSGRTHAYILMNCDLNNQERCLLQALFRSDPVREAYNLIRTMRNEKDSIALFETPDQAKLVQKWRYDITVGRAKRILEEARAAKRAKAIVIDDPIHSSNCDYWLWMKQDDCNCPYKNI